MSLASAGLVPQSMLPNIGQERQLSQEVSEHAAKYWSGEAAVSGGVRSNVSSFSRSDWFISRNLLNLPCIHSVGCETT